MGMVRMKGYDVTYLYKEHSIVVVHSNVQFVCVSVAGQGDRKKTCIKNQKEENQESIEKSS